MAEASERMLAVARATNRDFVLLCELYASETEPGADGFDPADALECFAKVGGITFAGQTYKRYVSKFGDIKRTTGPSFNSVSLEFTNHDRYLASFILNQPLGIEGYHLVVRMISQARSIALEDSVVLFTGRCEKAIDVDKETCSISAKQHIGTVDQEFPRRKYTPDDPEGRATTDPEFEGFIFTPQQIQVNYQERVPKGGFLGLLGFKKTVTRSLAYSSYSDIDANTVVPEVLGRTQLQGKVLAAVDQGAIIYSLYGWAEGPIEGFANDRVITPGFTRVGGVFYRYGEVGGYDVSGREQEPIGGAGGPNYPGNRHYSHTAWSAEAFTGTKVEENDETPDRVSTIIGRRVPVPDEFGVFPDTNGDTSLLQWSDNPAYLARWLLTVSHGFNLPASFIDDEVCIETAAYCDHAIEDEANSERVLLPIGLEDLVGNEIIRYHSTGLLTPDYIRSFYLSDGSVEPWTVEPTYEFHDPTDPLGPDLTPVKLLRRRYTGNVPITDTMKVVDLLFKILFPAARLYLTQSSKGKIQIRVKKPVDNTLVRVDTASGVTEIPVNSILAWIDNLRGKALIGANLVTSEVREVVGTRYSTAGNSITLAVTGGLTASGATFSGADDDTPAAATVTITDSSGGDITIDGVTVSYTGQLADVTGSVGAMLASAVNANPTLNAYVKAVWDASNPDTVVLQSKQGFLQLARATAKAHDASEEIIRIALSLSDSENDQADCTRANIKKGSFKWPQGSRQTTYNQAKGTYRDAVQDYRATPLVVNDGTHQAQINKKVPLEIDLAAVDNHHQASRVLNMELAEKRDGDFFTVLKADGEALLLDEGEVICVTESSGGFINLPIRIEDITTSQDLWAGLVGRRYLTSMYTDEVPEKTVPLPTTLIKALSVPIVLDVQNDGVRAWVTWKGEEGVSYDLAKDTSGNESTFLFSGPGGAANFAVLSGMTNVYLRARRAGRTSSWVTIAIPGLDAVAGRPSPYNLTGVADDTTHATFSWVRGATDNTSSRYSTNGGGAWTTIADPTITTVQITGSPGDTITLVVQNVWTTAPTESASSESKSVILPIAAPSANDPTNLRITSIGASPSNIASVAFTWNINSGTNPTLHFTRFDTFVTTTYNPTMTTETQRVTGMPGGTVYEAWVTTADGSNESDHITGTLPTYTGDGGL